jgi:outer membrane protein TolC
MNRLRRQSLILLAAGVVFAAGCVDQKRDVAAYRKILDNNKLPRLTQLPPGPLSLTQAFALANQNNENLGLSGEDYVQALIDKKRTVANFLPNISFQPSYSVADKPAHAVETFPLGPSIGATYRTNGKTMYSFQAPVVGSINLFRGFGDVANLEQAKQIIAQRRDLLLDLQASVLLNVAQVYYQILSSEQSVSVLNHSVQLQEARLDDVTQQFKNGLATRLAVAQTRADLDAARVEQIQAQGDVVNGRATLAYLIGAHDVPNPLIDDSAAIMRPVLPEHAYETQALKYRQDYLAAQRQVKAARQNVNVAVAEYYPTVTLNVEGFLYRQFYTDASKWDALLSVYLPIFSAGQIEADVRASWSRLRQAALEESQVRRAALRDVQTSYEDFQIAERRVQQLKDEVQAARDAYDQSRQAFANQLAINLDVLTSQDQLLNAQLQLSAATFDQTVYYLDLIRATGQLLNSQ